MEPICNATYRGYRPSIHSKTKPGLKSKQHKWRRPIYENYLKLSLEKGLALARSRSRTWKWTSRSREKVGRSRSRLGLKIKVSASSRSRTTRSRLHHWMQKLAAELERVDAREKLCTWSLHNKHKKNFLTWNNTLKNNCMSKKHGHIAVVQLVAI